MSLLSEVDSVLGESFYLTEGRFTAPPVLVSAVEEKLRGMLAYWYDRRISFKRSEISENRNAIEDKRDRISSIAGSLDAGTLKRTFDFIKDGSEGISVLSIPHFRAESTLFSIYKYTSVYVSKEGDGYLVWSQAGKGSAGSKNRTQDVDKAVELALMAIDDAAWDSQTDLDAIERTMEAIEDALEKDEDTLKGIKRVKSDEIKLKVPKDFMKGWRQARIFGGSVISQRDLSKAGIGEITLHLSEIEGQNTGGSFDEDSNSIAFRVGVALPHGQASHALHRVEVTAEHEVVHWAQYQLPVFLGLSGAIGLPIKGTDPGKASGWVRMLRGSAAYLAEPEEFFPWLSNEITRFKTMNRQLNTKPDNESVKRFMRSSSFFRALKQEKPKLWKRAAREFYRAAK